MKDFSQSQLKATKKAIKMQNRIEPKKIHYSLATKSVEEYCKYNQLTEEQKYCLKNCIIEQIKDFDLKTRM